MLVPNVPCGVERTLEELLTFPHASLVPNVPCEVESLTTSKRSFLSPWFLMYRVELKVALAIAFLILTTLFLMYRVELKASNFLLDIAF